MIQIINLLLTKYIIIYMTWKSLRTYFYDLLMNYFYNFLRNIFSIIIYLFNEAVLMESIIHVTLQITIFALYEWLNEGGVSLQHTPCIAPYLNSSRWQFLWNYCLPQPRHSFILCHYYSFHSFIRPSFIMQTVVFFKV